MINLKAERLDRGLSLRDAAKAAKVKPDVLLRAESGSQPRPAAAKKIADFYGYRVTEIWPVQETSAA